MATKILIVEDEIDIRDVYEEVLKEAGYEVATSGDGDEGLKLIKGSKWDLLLLDIILPKKDGLEILKEMVMDPELMSKPIVMLTNLEKESIVQKSLEMGAKEYVVKSNINPEDIVSTVGKYFSND